jgi:pilus assembly protein CpaD
MSQASDKTNAGARGTARRQLLAALALSTALLAACERHQGPSDALAVGLSNPELRHPIRFDARMETLDVEVPVGAEGLSPSQNVDVYRFLKRYKREANGRLVIQAPGLPRDPASMAQSLQGIQRHVVDAQIDYRLVRGKRQPAGEVPVIRIGYERPVAVPPACDKWGENVGRNEARIPYPNWGCATQHNLAVMVDNARDLQRPQDSDPRSSERRSVTWSGYVGVASPSGGGDSGGDAPKKATPTTKK